MPPKLDLKYLLSDKYEPSEDSPSKFRQSYNRLAEHRDELRRKVEAKDKRRAEMKKPEASAPTSKVQGSRFSSLLDMVGDDQATLPPAKHTFSASIKASKVDKLHPSERMTAVARIKADIRILEKEKKEKRAAAAGNSKEGMVREGVDGDGDDDDDDEPKGS